MASLYSSTSPSSFSSSRPLLAKKSSADISFRASYPCHHKLLSHGGNGRSIYYPSLQSRNYPSSLKVDCVRDFRNPRVTGKSWDKVILKSEAPVLVEFYASWCGPCQMVHRLINDIAQEYKGKVNCFLLNADNDPEVAENYDIKAVPVVLIFKNGEKRESIVGTMPKEFYVAAIEKVLET